MICPAHCRHIPSTPPTARSSFSNYGATRVHLGAPGSGIVSTVPASGRKNSVVSGYASYSGTSSERASGAWCPAGAGLASAGMWLPGLVGHGGAGREGGPAEHGSGGGMARESGLPGCAAAGATPREAGRHAGTGLQLRPPRSCPTACAVATPHVSGAAALYAAYHPTATAAQIKQAILNSATPTSSLAGRCVTGGRLNVAALMGVDNLPQQP